MNIKWIVPLIVLIASGSVSAQLPSTKTGSMPSVATIVRSGEVKASVDQNSSDAVADAVLRVVSVEGKYNVGVSAVRRSLVNGKTPPDAIVHDDVTEVYQILEGKGVLVTGGAVESATRLPADGAIVRQITGPSSRGTGIIGGTRQEVGPGDIVIIPANTAHGFVEIKTKRIVYTLIRIDPNKVLELKP